MASPFGKLVNISPPTCSTPGKKSEIFETNLKKITSKSTKFPQVTISYQE